MAGGRLVQTCCCSARQYFSSPPVVLDQCQAAGLQSGATSPAPGHQAQACSAAARCPSSRPTFTLQQLSASRELATMRWSTTPGLQCGKTQEVWDKQQKAVAEVFNHRPLDKLRPAADKPCYSVLGGLQPQPEPILRWG